MKAQVTPCSKDAYTLLHNGARALAQIEAAGMRVDIPYLDAAIKRTERQVKRLQARMERTDVARTWRKAYGPKTNFDSTQQLGDILFDWMGFDGSEETAGGSYKTDKVALGKIDHPFVRDMLRVRQLGKALNTNLRGLKREVQDEYLHPFFNLHTTTTFRSSSDHPNFQNIPVREEGIKQLVRRAIIPRPGRQLVEVDYSGIEVRIAACYHQDPVMIEYIRDETKDMHRDMAMECYMLAAEEVTKPIRYCGKNMFVFPQFYGDWYVDCAKSLWNATSEMGLVTESGLALGEHLKAKGIRRRGACIPGKDPVPGTFEAHIQAVEHRFWQERFRVYDQWKKDWFKAYQRKGSFRSKTGFLYQGYLKRNEVINYPVQGSAFHCLLWALSRLVLRELRRNKMKALVIGQIHDSIVSDVPEAEVDDYLLLTQEVMVEKLMKAWPWICVPLVIEAEVAPVTESWVAKKEVRITLAEHKAGWQGLEPGTREWSGYWILHPDEQEQMIAYTRARKIG